MDNIFIEICKAYGLKGELIEVIPLKRGHINNTYRVDLDQDGKTKSYLFQRVNHYVFKKPELIIKNVQAVTSHVRRKLEEMGEPDVKRKVIRLYKHNDKSLYVTKNGEYWRVMTFVYNAATYDVFDNDMLRAVGKGFGRFIAMLSDFPGGDLYETIPNFHNTPLRFDALFRAYREDIKGRAAEISEEVEYLRTVYKYASRFNDLYNQGLIPWRVTHNDTKGNNIMIDVAT